MKTNIRIRLTAALLALGLSVSMIPVAAADEGETIPESVTIRSVTLSNNTVAMTEGDSVTLSATVNMSNNTSYNGDTEQDLLPEDMEVTWEVQDNRDDEVSITDDPTHPLKVELNALSVAETNAENKAVSITVSVKMGETTPINETCKVTVSSAEPPSITLSSPAVELEVGGETTLIATVKPETDPPREVTWSNQSDAVATVTAVDHISAKVIGVAPGETTVSASAGAGIPDGTCQVTVRGIALTETSATILVHEKFTLGYEIFGAALQDRAVEWSSDKEDVVSVEGGYLYGVSAGTATITAKISGYSDYTATCTVTVKSNTADPIKISVDAGVPVSLSGYVSTLQNCCTAVLGEEASLSYISNFTFSTSQGTLYYRYQSESDTGAGIGTAERYYVSPTLSQMGLSDVTFVPKADFSGKAVISYTGYADETTFFQGTIEVTVAQVEDIVYTTSADKALQFNVDDFNRLCRANTGRELDAVSFSLPDSSRGTLYYRYSADASYNTPVEATKAYQRNGTPSLGDVYFVPNSGYSGEVTLSFLATDINGSTFRGRVRIQVSKAAVNGDLNYTVSKGGWITFSDSDFNTLCRSATGYTLDYVRFTLPPASQGALYYNYSGSTSGYGEAVTADSNYYYTSTPYLRRVTFAAASSYTGTVSIPFRAWDTKGNQFSGTVNILVESTDGGAIRYTAFQGGKATFDDTDFHSQCQKLTGGTLSYVRFQLPSSSQGALYYNYTSSSSYDHAVTSTRSYYRSSTPYIDKVSFVPKSGFTGAATVQYTGWATNGKSFTGTITIDVYDSARQIAYTLTSGGVADFNAVDFDRLCEYYTGDALRYVRFTLPSSSKGVLYYDYNTASGSSGSKVSASSSYYYSSSPYLDRVSFVADGSYAGSLEIAFTGWSTGGKSFKGTVQITVQAPQAATVLYYTASNGVAAFNGSDFVSACAARGLGSLTSVRFNLPSSSQGKLYYRYSTTQSGTVSVQNTTSYYPSSTPRISDVSFVAASGFSGVATVTYTGTDSRGNTYQGQIRVNVPAATTSRYFTDLTGYAWAITAIDRLYEQGIVTGTGGGRYSPQNSISRGDFMLMLDRAFGFRHVSGTGFTDVPADSYYASAIAAAKAMGVAAGYSDGTFRPNAPVSRQDAMLFLKRAMIVDGWSLGSGDTSLLWGFRDGSQVANYAADAVSTMIAYGILAGNNNGELNPTANMSRAEMAVVLSRVLSL